MPKSIKKSKSLKPLPPSEQVKPTDYQVVLHWSDEDECYIATLPAWQNAKTHGRTIEQASRNAMDVLTMLIADAKKRGHAFPPVQKRFSGNLRLRLPESLHAKLAREAEREGVSLNHWLVTRLALTT